jgi:hypothetical protein
MTSVEEALAVLKPPLKFGNDKQIRARVFLEEVEQAKEQLLACERLDHKEMAKERFDENPRKTKTWHLMKMEEELFDCGCTPRLASEVLMAVSEVLVNEWWPKR